MPRGSVTGDIHLLFIFVGQDICFFVCYFPAATVATVGGTWCSIGKRCVCVCVCVCVRMCPRACVYVCVRAFVGWIVCIICLFVAVFVVASWLCLSIWINFDHRITSFICRRHMHSPACLCIATRNMFHCSLNNYYQSQQFFHVYVWKSDVCKRILSGVVPSP